MFELFWAEGKGARGKGQRAEGRGQRAIKFNYFKKKASLMRDLLIATC
jgi:hypothetical protein